MKSGKPGFWDGLVIFVDMSRIGLAYHLTWYRSIKVRIEVVPADQNQSGQERTYAVIDVMGLAKIRYSDGFMRWDIRRPTYCLTYVIGIWKLGNKLWMTYGKCDCVYPDHVMSPAEYEEWSRKVLGWQIEPKSIN